MLEFAVGFLLGDCAIQLLPTLPNPWPWAALIALAAALAAIARHTLVCALLCGASWTFLLAHSILTDQLAPALEGEELTLVGAVASIPILSETGVRFVLDTEHGSAGVPQHIELSWFDPRVRIAPGERWRLRVKLRRPRGFSNPGGFDYERQLLSERIGASGYIRDGSDNRKLAPASNYFVLRMRAAIAQRLALAVQPSPMSGLMRGLAVGDQQAISAADWRVFANTGTTHLVAISGFHIGVVAAFFGLLCGMLARLPFAQRACLTRSDAKALGTIVGGVLYAALAGFSIPTQRTLVVLCVYCGMRLLRRHISPWRGFAISLIGVLFLDPLAPLAIGFWLSFVAVAVILLALDGRLAPHSTVHEHVRMQSIVTVALVPVLICAFGGVSLVAPFVNLIAIPFFSCIAVPGILIGVLLLWICAPAGTLALIATAHLLEWTWPALEWCAQLPLAMWYFPERSVCSLLLGFAGAVLWALPIAPLRATALALCMPVIVSPSERVETGTFELAVLDVGQGLAVVVRTRSHTLIFDTGPAFRSGRDTGELVIVPYLHSRGIRRADVLMLSHGDMDHVGGVKSILADIAVERVLRGPSVNLHVPRTDACIAGQTWQWDGVEFKVLHPSDLHDAGRNNSSCVLQIGASSGRALIMGDVERDAELALVEHHAVSVADIVVAAHHGSRTSSTEPFVAAAHARYVVFSAGWRNRWGFPKPDVVQHWEAQGAKSFSTFRSGATEFKVTPRGVEYVHEYRIEHRRYWSALTVDS